MKALQLETKLEKEQMWAIIHRFVGECSDSELSELLQSIKEEYASRIAHLEENYNKYWDKESEHSDDGVDGK